MKQVLHNPKNTDGSKRLCFKRGTCRRGPNFEKIGTVVCLANEGNRRLLEHFTVAHERHESRFTVLWGIGTWRPVCVFDDELTASEVGVC